MADLRGTRDTRPPLSVQFFFNIMHFSEKIAKIISWHPNLWGWRPLLGNPGSATTSIVDLFNWHCLQRQNSTKILGLKKRIALFTLQRSCRPVFFLIKVHITSSPCSRVKRVRQNQTCNDRKNRETTSIYHYFKRKLPVNKRQSICLLV